MRYLITGGDGFLGRATVAEAILRGAEVNVLSRDPERARSVLPAGVSVFGGDVRERESLQPAMRGVDHVIHLASDFRNLEDDTRRSWEVNVEGTRNVLAIAEAAGVVRVVHCSTIGVHGSLSRLPGTEESPIQPGDVPYERHKAKSEEIARDYHLRGHVDVSIVRPGGIYGPGDLRLLKLFRMIAKGFFPLFGGGKAHMDLVYVNDVARGLLLASTHPRASGETFIISGGEPRTVLGTAHLIAELIDAPPPRLVLPITPFLWAARLTERCLPRLGISPPLTQRRLGLFTNDRAFSIRKASSVLGYEVAHSLRTGLAETADWYCSEGLL